MSELDSISKYEPKTTVLGENEAKGDGEDLEKNIWDFYGVVDSGMKCNNEKVIKAQRGVVWELVKKIGNNLLEGKDLVSMTLPVTLFQPKSWLELIAEFFVYAPHYLRKAGQTTDPVERLKLCTAFCVAALHTQNQNEKPFNPILGETLQGHFSDGTEVICEQISHHPPISAWQVFDKNGLYECNGFGEWSASMRSNSVKACQKGEGSIVFPDGTVITYVFPQVAMKGIMWGERVMEFQQSMFITDHKNNMEAEIIFNPGALGYFKSFFVSQKTPVHQIGGSIYRILKQDPSGSRKNMEKEEVSKIHGSWCLFLNFDNERYWDVRRVVPYKIALNENALPSDCKLRSDLLCLKAGDMDGAAEYKEKLEKLQRYDAKLRKDAAQQRAKNGKK